MRLERNFSALAHLIGDLHSSILPVKDEYILFVRLNKQFIEEVKELDAAVKQMLLSSRCCCQAGEI